MSRKPRAKSNNGIYHVVVRGVNKSNIFEEDEDKEYFLEKFFKLQKEINFEIYCYCLMDNHVHFLIKEGDQDVSKIIQRLTISYSIWFNRKYDRCGHLFQGRFKSRPVDDVRYFLTVFRYILQNPVKAKICINVEDFCWSSINEYRLVSEIVCIDYVMKMFGFRKDEMGKIYEFVRIPEENECIDIDEPRWFSDRKTLEIIKKKAGITSPFELQSFDVHTRNAILREILIDKKISCRQVARITGISLSVVKKQRSA